VTSLVYIGRLVGALELRFERLLAGARAAVVIAALALPMTSANWARHPLPDPFSFSVVPSDVLILCAIGLWIVPRIFFKEDAPILSTPLYSWPLVFFALAIVPGIVRGHERFGAGVVGQPVRLVLYAAIGLALLNLDGPRMYRILIWVFYLGAAWQLVLGLYSLAVGEHQTGSYVLSTGGTRFLSVSSAVYMGATVLLSLINIEIGVWGRYRFAHLVVAAVAGLAVVLSFARTTFLALVIAVPLVLFFLPATRAWLIRAWKIWAPALALIVLVAGVALPSIRSTLIDRVTANPIQDHTVRWRVASFQAALTGLKSGQWRPSSPLQETGNQLMNPGFEQGTIGWFTQGGTIETVPSNNPNFGTHALEFTTDGSQPDEGPFSLPALATKGQDWRLSIWLSAAQGGEHVSLGIWEYDAGGEHTGYTNFPLTLSVVPKHYYLNATVIDPHTAYVRAVIRTTEAIAIKGYADNATLEPVDRAPATIAPYGRNYLTNPTFDAGVTDWGMQGGTLESAQSPGEGHAAEMKSDGNAADEGMYSTAVSVHPGERWTFALDLRSKTPGQVVNLAIWQYDRNGESVLQDEAPIMLGTAPLQYRVTTTISEERVKSIRALVRTGTDPSSVDVIADDALLAEGSVAIEPAVPPPAVPAEGTPIMESLLGVGFGRSFNYMWEGGVYHLDGDPHNSFIWVLGGSGLLGLVGLLLVFGAFLGDTIRRFRRSRGIERGLLLWVLGTWFLIMMTTLTEPLLTEPSLLLSTWVVMLIPAVVGRHRLARRKS